MRLWEGAPWMVQLMTLKASHPLPAVVPHPPVAPNTWATSLVTKHGYHFVIITNISANRTALEFKRQV